MKCESLYESKHEVLHDWWINQKISKSSTLLLPPCLFSTSLWQAKTFIIWKSWKRQCCFYQFFRPKDWAQPCIEPCTPYKKSRPWSVVQCLLSCPEKVPESHQVAPQRNTKKPRERVDRFQRLLKSTIHLPGFVGTKTGNLKVSRKRKASFFGKHNNSSWLVLVPLVWNSIRSANNGRPLKHRDRSNGQAEIWQKSQRRSVYPPVN